MQKNFRNLTNAPFTYLVPSLTNASVAILFLLLPQLVMLFITKSFNSLIIILISLVSSILAELTDCKIRHEKMQHNLVCVLHGLFIGMFIPSNYPLIPIAFIVYLSLLVSKYFFGHLSDSWINPVSYTVIILYLIGMSFFPETLLDRTIMENGTPTLTLIQNGTLPVLQNDTTIAFWLNTHIFSHLGIEIPTGYISLFWDSQSVIPAFRFNLLTLFSSIILLAFDMINWIVPTIFLVVYGVLVALFSETMFTGMVGQGDVLLAFLTSGTLFTAFFIVDSYGTSPYTTVGKIIYGTFAGLVAFLICGNGTSSIGNMFVVLIANVVSPVIEYVEDKIYSVMIEKRMRKNKYA